VGAQAAEGEGDLEDSDDDTEADQVIMAISKGDYNWRGIESELY
jgi:hypothetical protein